jgi:hypothetical protein
MLARWRWWLFGLVAVPLAVWGYDRVQMMCWVGGTDLEIEFVVTDAATGKPVEGATITVHSEGGFYDEREEKDFTLRTDRHGIARRVCHNSMCFGTQSALRFTDTYVVHLPWWYVWTSAPGYEKSSLLYLDTSEHGQRVQRVGAGAARVGVSISLRKRRV